VKHAAWQVKLDKYGAKQFTNVYSRAEVGITLIGQEGPQ
jgi:hypothetical protein